MRSSVLIHPGELSPKWIDRLSSCGISALGIHPEGGSRAAESLDRLLDGLRAPAFRALLDTAAAKGLEIEYELHAAGWLLERGLFDAHPEYFRMNAAGERTPDRNLCVSCPDALQRLAARAAGLARQLYRSGSRFYFWMDDDRDAACHCPACRQYSPSEQQLLAVNAMLSEIRKGIPDAQLAYLAYFGCVEPPRRVRPAPGVFLEYAPVEKYVSANDPGRAGLIRQEAERIPELLACFGSSGAKVLEYWYDNSLFSDWKKPPRRFTPQGEIVRREVRQYRAMGFETISTFGCYLGADYEALYGEPDLTDFAAAVAGR